jgi:hypothetical protein
MIKTIAPQNKPATFFEKYQLKEIKKEDQVIIHSLGLLSSFFLLKIFALANLGLGVYSFLKFFKKQIGFILH